MVLIKIDFKKELKKLYKPEKVKTVLRQPIKVNRYA